MSIRFKSKQNAIHHNTTPVFNKRIFKAQAGIVLTEEVLLILNRPLAERRSKTDVEKLKSVVHGLKDVHKGFQFIKDALGFVIGYEKVAPNVEVKKKPSESDLSCYYILTGSIEATYAINNTEPKQTRTDSLKGKSKDNASPDGCVMITYTHIAGDYLGLVSGDGQEYDLPPPQAIKTMEVCEFLRIDRKKFHQAVRIVHNQYVQEVEHFINCESILRHLPEKEREKLVPLMAKQEYGAGRIIVNQGEVPDHMFFIAKGRCQFFRRVYIKEASRLELVKLGQIEKGEVFGESSVLDGSPCFCSVASIGQVTCFLINKWVIKTNEHVLNLLREHRHQFYEDDMIQHFIKDSDVWQSYKRSRIIELLEATNKQFIAVEKRNVSETLETAVAFGDAKRLHSAQASKQREAGEPQPKEPLFVAPRSRRRSSAILHSNAAAVVKAVLLLRRNIDDDNESHVQLPVIKTQAQRIKPVSAPSRYRSRTTSPLHSAKEYRSPKTEQKHLISKYKHENSSTSRPKGVNVVAKSTSPTTSRRQEGSQDTSNKYRPQTNIIANTRKNNRRSVTVAQVEKGKITATPNKVQEDSEIKQTSSGDVKSHNEHGLEKCVSSSRHFIVKEIINTGNPRSRRQSLPSRYQRFDKSMFAILDSEKGDSKIPSAPSPWGVSLAVSKWMAGIRKKRMRNEADGITPSPTPPPLIVIEEYAPQNALSDDQSEDENIPGTTLVTRPPLRTPTPSLEQLQEEKDEDIVEYNKLEAGISQEDKWYTAIHKARDESKSHLKQLRMDLEILNKDRDQRKGTVDQLENSAFNDDVCSERSSDETTSEQNTEVGNGCTSSNTRKHSTRSRTVSMSTTVDSQTAGSSRTRKSSRVHRNHYSSYYLDQTTTTHRNNDIKTAIRARHERRRLLLLEKIGL